MTLIITLTPMRREDRLSVSKAGDLVTINGEIFNLYDIPEGATLPQTAVACDWLASDVERLDGNLYLTLILPHGANATEEALFPEPIIVEVDGLIELPA